MLLKLFRIIYKLFLVSLGVLFFMIISSVVFLLPTGVVRRRKNLMGVSRVFDWMFLKIFSIRVKHKGGQSYDRKKTYYVMGNHMTFLDVFIVVSKFSVLFITSNEMKKRPVLGQIAYFTGCLFVERRKITTLKDEIPRIGNVLKSGLNICLFPEATTSDGRALLPFKGALIESVVGTGVEVLPVCITYRKINGRDMRKSDFVTIGYFGGVKFPPQLFKVLMLKSIDVELEILEPLGTEGKDRKEIMGEVFESINSRYTEYLGSIKD